MLALLQAWAHNWVVAILQRKQKGNKMAKRTSKATPAPAAGTRTTLALARTANKANGMLAPTAKVVPAAAITQTAKGANPTRMGVYGYSNNNRVPLASRVLLVTGASAQVPKGILPAQFASLQKLAKAGTQTVSALYGAGISSRTMRRAYRAGVIRFAA